MNLIPSALKKARIKNQSPQPDSLLWKTMPRQTGRGQGVRSACMGKYLRVARVKGLRSRIGAFNDGVGVEFQACNHGGVLI